MASLLVAINGYLYFLRLSYLQQEARTAQEAELRMQELRANRQNSPSTGSGQSAETADWKTYRNEEYGFEIKYPGDYIIYAGLNLQSETYVSANPSSTKIMITENNNHVFCCEPFVFSVEVRSMITSDLDVWVNREFINSDNSYRVTKKGFEEFAGQNAYRIYTTVGIDSPRNIIVFNRAGKTFLIRYDNEDIFDQILSTFRFNL